VCYIKEWECRKAFRKETETKTNICKHVNDYYWCMVRDSCLDFMDKKQTFVDAAQVYLQNNDPDCVLDTNVTPSPEPGKQTSVTDSPISEDCDMQEWRCGKVFRKSVRAGNNTSETMCTHINEFYRCLMDASCLENTEERQRFTDETKAFMHKNAPDC
ncbi:hypothetical protein EGW08_009902, partial [Elysia chlorotica]